jgi:Cgr1 family
MDSRTRTITKSSSSCSSSSISNVSGGVEITEIIPKGRSVSGRTWKTSVQKRASSLIKTKINNQSTTWETKTAEKNTRQLALQLEKEMRDTKKAGIIEKKERRLLNEKRRAENEYNTIKNAAQNLNSNKLKSTLKAMSKKQLRQIKKTRINTKTGVVEYVPMFTK